MEASHPWMAAPGPKTSARRRSCRTRPTTSSTRATSRTFARRAGEEPGGGAARFFLFFACVGSWRWMARQGRTGPDNGGFRAQQMRTTYPRRSGRLPFVAALLAIAATAAAQAPPPAEPVPPCIDSPSDGVLLFASPQSPQPDGALRAVAVSERRLAATLVVVDPDGLPAAAENQRRGGPPYWWYVDLVPRKAGQYRAILRHGTTTLGCR